MKNALIVLAAVSATLAVSAAAKHFAPAIHAKVF